MNNSDRPALKRRQHLGMCSRYLVLVCRLRISHSALALDTASPFYFVKMGLDDVGGVAAAGERLNVSQRFQPDARFAASNSPCSA
jgi:hypothetical protein